MYDFRPAFQRGVGGKVGKGLDAPTNLILFACIYSGYTEIKSSSCCFDNHDYLCKLIGHETGSTDYLPYS